MRWLKSIVASVLVSGMVLTGVGCADPGAAPPHQLVVGAAQTPTSRMIAAIYQAALLRVGAPVRAELSYGNTADLMTQLGAASVDVVPVFGGQALTILAPQSAAVTSDDVFTDLNRALPQGVSAGDATMVGNTQQLYVRAGTSIDKLSDCGQLPPAPLVYAGDRPTQLIDAVTSAAGCRFTQVRAVPNVPDAVRATNAFGVLSALDPASQSPELTALADKDQLVRSQDLIPLMRTAALTREQVKGINKVAGELTTTDLIGMVAKVVAGKEPGEIAGTWMAEHAS